MIFEQCMLSLLKRTFKSNLKVIYVYLNLFVNK